VLSLYWQPVAWHLDVTHRKRPGCQGRLLPIARGRKRPLADGQPEAKRTFMRIGLCPVLNKALMSAIEGRSRLTIHPLALLSIRLLMWIRCPTLPAPILELTPRCRDEPK